MAPLSPTLAYHFGPFVLDLKARLLCLNDVVIPLTQKEFLTLILLVEVAGEAVSRETLIRTIWPDTVVGDTSLGRNISVLRRHLGTDAIQSISKFGYRFTLPVTVVENVPSPPEPEPPTAQLLTPDPPPIDLAPDHNLDPGQSADPVQTAIPPSSEDGQPLARFGGTGMNFAAVTLVAFAAALSAWKLNQHPAPPPPPTTTAAPPPVVRLAVLPFHNTSAHPAETDYLRDGFNDELTARLGALQPRQMRVLARGTTRQYLDSTKLPKLIAAESGAQYLLEGSIGFTAGHTQLMASLVNPADQTIMWSRTFAGTAAELDTIEGEIVEAVGSNLDLVSSRSPGDPAALSAAASQSAFIAHIAPAAYDEYLRGRFELEQKNLPGYRHALGHFQTASLIAPEYAQAWAGIAETYIFMGGIIPMNECFRRSREAALKAIQLDPALGEAHRDLAYILMNDESDLAGAEREYKRAIDLNPDDARAHHWYAQLLAAQRRQTEALAQATDGYELDPRSVGSGSNYGFIQVASGDAVRGVAVLEELVKREPAVDYTWGYLGFGYLRLQQFAKAAAAFDHAAELGTLKINYSSCAAYARARGGDPSPASTALAQLQRLRLAGKWVPAQSLAVLYLALGERDQARQWLLKGAEDRTVTLFEANTDPVYSEMKDDPGFPQLIARLQKAQ